MKERWFAFGLLSQRFTDLPPGPCAWSVLTHRPASPQPSDPPGSSLCFLCHVHQLRDPSSEKLPPLAELTDPPLGSLGSLYLQLILVILGSYSL